MYKWYCVNIVYMVLVYVWYCVHDIYVVLRACDTIYVYVYLLSHDMRTCCVVLCVGTCNVWCCTSGIYV